MEHEHQSPLLVLQNSDSLLLDHCKTVLPLGTDFKSKEKLKHFDKWPLGTRAPGCQEGVGHPSSHGLLGWPPAGGAWARHGAAGSPKGRVAHASGGLTG